MLLQFLFLNAGIALFTSCRYIRDMKYIVLVALTLFLVMLFSSEPEDDVASLLESHLWQNNVVMILRGEEGIEQDALDGLLQQKGILNAQDIIIYDVVYLSYVKRAQAALPHVPASRFFDYFDTPHRGVTMLLLGKDGEVRGRYNAIMTAEKLLELFAG